jgi:hypothetical protein
VKQLVPWIGVLVIVLCHVLLKCRHSAVSVLLAYTYTPWIPKNQEKEERITGSLARLSGKAL